MQLGWQETTPAGNRAVLPEIKKELIAWQYYFLIFSNSLEQKQDTIIWGRREGAAMTHTTEFILESVVLIEFTRWQEMGRVTEQNTFDINR